MFVGDRRAIFFGSYFFPSLLTAWILRTPDTSSTQNTGSIIHIIHSLASHHFQSESDMLVRPLLFTSVIAASRRSSLPSTVAMSMSASTSGDKQCSGKYAVIFLHGLGDTPAGWSSLEYQLPSLKPSLGQDVHYVFPPAPTIGITINGGYEMPGWFGKSLIVIELPALAASFFLVELIHHHLYVIAWLKYSQYSSI
jgi:hypothetical protein